jgi:hypothetical protein
MPPTKQWRCLQRRHGESRVLLRRLHQRQIDFALAQHAFQVGGVGNDNAHATFREPRLHDRETLQPLRATGGGKADAQRRLHIHLGAQHILTRSLHGVEDLPGVFMEHLTGMGEHHPATVALEQAGPQFLLQFAKSLTQRRLGHVQRPGRGGDAAMLDHGAEVPHALQIHITPICFKPE